MKYLQLLPPIALCDVDDTPITDEHGKPATLTHVEFLFSRLRDPQWAQSIEWIEAQAEIKRRIKAAQAAGAAFVALERADHDKLLHVTTRPDPRNGYNAAVIGSVAPFIASIRNATDEEPKSGEEPKSEAAP